MIETLALVPWDHAETYQYIAVTFVLAYLAGSIPFGVIFTRAAGAGDLRRIGSGNIGATNVLRTGKRWAAAATLICDAGKGAIAVIVAKLYFGGPFLGIPLFAMIAALGAFLGHLFPLWLRFKGGKGVATFLGIALGLNPFVCLSALITWLAVAWLFRVSSAAALGAALATPVYFWLLGEVLFAALAAVLTLIIFITHRGNIERLLTGQEPRIGH